MMILCNDLKIPFDKINIVSFVKQYHFCDADMELICSVIRMMCEVITVRTALFLENNYVVGAVSLGNSFDRFEALMMEENHLTISYCMECFSMELLAQSYEMINEIVYEEKGKWLADYHFLEANEMEDVHSFDELLGKIDVVWERGMLKPLKSVIFRADYTQQKNKAECLDCRSCKNVQCIFRK